MHCWGRAIVGQIIVLALWFAWLLLQLLDSDMGDWKPP